MGHLGINPDRAYGLLQERLDRNPTGAPDSPAFRRILRLLFTPEDADLARRLPTRLTSLSALAKRLRMEPARLDDTLTRLARRGLVFDLELRGRRYFSLAPVVIGFFELTFMRGGDDLPREELARLFEDYFFEGDGRFARAVFEGDTQIGRSLPRETALGEAPPVEVLDWERASRIVEGARTVSVSLCACRHHADHLGRACERPQRACLSFDVSAETLVRSGHAERIDAAEGLRILAECQAAGLAQTADNVQRGVGYICNCCGCCCGMMRAIRRFDLPHAIVSSNWIAEVDDVRCNGCGLCVKACPTGALCAGEAPAPGGRRPPVRRDADLCLGCGVCTGACKRSGIGLSPRPSRVFTPETTFERVVAMAIERGKLVDLVLDDPEGLGARAVGLVLKALEAAPPVRAAVAIKPLRSAFLSAFLPAARLLARDSSDALA